jgi:hypothetical protein
MSTKDIWDISKEKLSLDLSREIIPGLEVEPIGDNKLEGKTLLLDPLQLKPVFRTEDNLLWKAISGFGCSHYLRGKSIFCENKQDSNEKASWPRMDFIGIVTNS